MIHSPWTKSCAAMAMAIECLKKMFDCCSNWRKNRTQGQTGVAVRLKVERGLRVEVVVQFEMHQRSMSHSLEIPLRKDHQIQSCFPQLSCPSLQLAWLHWKRVSMLEIEIQGNHRIRSSKSCREHLCELSQRTRVPCKVSSLCLGQRR